MGKLFTPQNHDLPMRCKAYAQSPQAIILEDRFRIYCTSRAEDKGGKFLSKVIYVDFDFGWNFIAHSTGEVIPLGKLGAFDEHGIFPFSPYQDEGRLTAYTCGWSRRVSVDVETATGFAESFDGGQTFQKRGDGPVFASSLHEPMLVGDSFVRRYNGTYHMWYMYGTKWVREHDDAKPDRVYKVGHAVSDDGLDWQPGYKQIVPDVLHDNECQALPSVLYHEGIYHMVFAYRDVFGFRDNPSKGYRIGYAYSMDAQNWVRDDECGGLAEPQDEWDRDMMSYPHLMQHEGNIYCLYNGNKFGHDGFGGYHLDQSSAQWKHNQADKTQILDHLKNCDPDFISELSLRVDLDAYVEKLIDKAQRIEIWDSKKLIALVAIYWGDDQDYITNVSVDRDYVGQGIGAHCMQRCVAISKSQGKSSIVLEVQGDNRAAIKLYKKTGFVDLINDSDYCKMILNLK